jgi:hypothetical protein
MRLLAALVLAIPSLAAAEPSAASSAPAVAGDYLQAGVVAGALRANRTSSGALYGAITLEAGHHVQDSALWLHVQLASGSLAGIDEASGASQYLEGRVGVETRGCVLGGAACLVGGLDLGARREYLMAEYDHFDSTTVALVARAGLDVGSRRLRLRPTLELALGSDGNGGGLSLAAAYVW